MGRFINADDTDQLDANKDHIIQQNLFAYCLNNPVNHTDPNGNWILDAIFLAVDVATAISHPSWGNAAWVLLDVACFADPTGAASAGFHVLKAAHAVEETSHAINEAAKAGKLIGRYGKVKPAARGLGLETHHLVEKRFAKTLNVRKSDMLSVALTKGQHRIYTNKWRKALPYKAAATRKQISRAINTVYHDNKSYRHAAHQWLKSTRR